MPADGRTPVARAGALAGVGLGACVLAVLAVQGGIPFVGRLAAGHRVVLLDEGPQDTTAVVDVQVGSQRAQRLIYSNGISYTGDNAPSRRYMRLLGHLPALLADDPGNSLVICIGTGMTAAALGRHPEVRVLDLVDISPVVRRTLPLFSHVNDRIHADPRVAIHQADGRQFMGRATRAYGVVTLEPPPPRAAGAASLYTVEMYQRAKQAMRPGGMIAQWLPLHGLSHEELALLARSFLAVFPNAALFMLNRDEAALLGSANPLVVDVPRLLARLSSPAVQESLRGIGFQASDPRGLAGEILGLAPLHGTALADFVGPGPVVTDDRPLVESFAAVIATAGNSPQQLGSSVLAHSGDAEPGRALFVARLLSATWSPLPVRGSPPPDSAAALARLRSELASPPPARPGRPASF
jgi:spermidine synthase